MAKQTLKPGMHVRIRRDLTPEYKYDKISFVAGMNKWKDKLVEISSVNGNSFYIAGDPDRWLWSSKMIEEIVSTDKELKVGQVVRVRRDLVPGRSSSKVYITDSMAGLAGRLVTIAHVDNKGIIGKLRHIDDPRQFAWDADCFEPVIPDYIPRTTWEPSAKTSKTRLVLKSRPSLTTVQVNE